MFCFFCKQKTAYDMRISDWSSDVCSSDLPIEVSGLYHSFFVLAGSFAAEQGGRPSNHTLFLRRVFAAHEGKPDFLSALGWASKIGRASCRERVCQYV